jgi:hypothetical protein
VIWQTRWWHAGWGDGGACLLVGRLQVHVYWEYEIGVSVYWVRL